MPSNLQDFNYWLICYSLNVAAIPPILIAWIYLVKSTPTNRRWTTPFNLCFALFATSILFFLNFIFSYYYMHPLAADWNKRRIALACNAVSMNLHALVAEVSLAWMAYKIYPWKKFRTLLPAIIIFIAARVGAQIWASVLKLSGKDTRAAGSTMAILLMWNLIFFSGLFIYRYRRKLQNTFRTSRFYKTVLDISVQNAILPTIIVIPAVITNFLFPEPTILMVNGVLTTLFRFILTVVIANSLNLINLRNYSEKNRQTMTTRNNASRLTSLHLVSSFGLEHRADIILENFLLGLHSILGGEKGYFVERNRNGQMSLICGFSFERGGEESEKVTIISANDATKIEKVPIAALEYALDQAYPILFDLDLETEENVSIRCFLGDQIEYVNSVFILPITSPESGKHKTIYVENVESGGMVDLRILELMSQHLAASLDSARLFDELNNMNRSLEHEVNRRTAELEQKTMQLERANIVALEAANAKAVFLSNMSHEIRTPISQVILASELLTETISSVEGKEYANIITSSGRLLLNLVNDILDFSKLESGKVILEEISFNLHGLIQITMDAFSTEKDCRVGHYISKDTPMYVIGDETRLRQILTNLVSNAIKFTDRGFVMLFVTSQHTAELSYDIRFRIIDTGCGIAADKIDKIFGRFEQEDGSITRKFGGTGLGLSICQNLCHLMGSRLTVQSQPDYGSTFSFTVHFQQAVDPIICSPFFHTVSMQPKILLLQDTSLLFESKSVLAYQLETMGCTTECERLQAYDPPESMRYRLVVVDLVDYYCCDVSIILRILQSSSIPLLITHSTSQMEFVNGIITTFADPSSNATSNTLIRTLCHPHKQSSLFRVVSGLLSEVEMIDSRMDQVEDILTQPIPTHEESTVIKEFPGESNGDRKINILLAEDNPINQRIICTMIHQLGYTVDVAEDGIIAVQMAREKYYDLILMDVRMPNMNGLEATRQIRSLHYEAGGPFIVGLSADVMSSNVDSGLEAGMDLYMSKPVSRSKLSEMIEQASTMSQQ